MMMVGLATFGSVGGGLLLILIGMSCLLTCQQMRAMMKAEGPYAFQDEDAFDYGASLYAASDKPKRPGLRERIRAKRTAKLVKEEANERKMIDAILAKVSAHGMQSLSWMEKRALKKATEHQRQRDVELRSSRRGL
jgi:hypothetical protein